MLQKTFLTLFTRLKNDENESVFLFPFALLILALATYALFIFSLGYYWDDWFFILLSHVTDKSAVLRYFFYDRPFQAWTYYVLFPICRDSTVLWQLSEIIFRWTTALTFYFTFLRLFPNQKTLLRWAAAIFVVFPGFANEYASVAFGSHFMVMTAFGLSLLFMVRAVQTKKNAWIYLSLSLVFTILDLFSMEYFVGLEVLRPILLFIGLKNGQKDKKRVWIQSLKFWAPYLVLLLIYVYWRLILYPAALGGMTDKHELSLLSSFHTDPIVAVDNLIAVIYADARYFLISSWTDRLIPTLFEFKRATLWLSLFVGLAVSLLFYLIVIKYRKGESREIKNNEYLTNIILSCLIFICGMLPSWIILQQASAGGWSDRFGLPVMFGSALFTATLFFLAIPNNRIRNILFIAVVGLSMSFQIQVGNSYRKDFEKQSQFFTELKWRIPDLEPGTLLYTSMTSDFSFKSPGVNLLYSGNEVDETLDYWVTYPENNDLDEMINNPGQPVVIRHRSFTFNGSNSKVVSYIFPQVGCLRIVDAYNALYLDGYEADPRYAQISDQNLIIDDDGSKNGLADVFNFNQTNTWCYFYEKGDLAQSKGRYADATALYEEAIAKGFRPDQSIEYMPFIISYAKLGQIDEAVSLSDKAIKNYHIAKTPICQFWHDISAQDASIQPSAISSVYNKDNCPAFFGGGN